MTHSQDSQVRTFRSFLRQLTQQDAALNRRSQSRNPRSLSLQIQPLDSDFQPDGESFWAITRDISMRGIGFVNPEPVTHDFIRIGVLDFDKTIIARVCHSTSIGVDYPLFLVGVEFIGKEF